MNVSCINQNWKQRKLNRGIERDWELCSWADQTCKPGAACGILPRYKRFKWNYGEENSCILHQALFALYSRGIRLAAVHPRLWGRFALDMVTKLAESIIQLCWNTSCFKVKIWTWICIFAQYARPRVLAIHTTRTDTHLRLVGKYYPCWCDTPNPSARYRLDKLLPMPNTSGCRSVCMCGSGALCHAWVVGQQLLPIWELNVKHASAFKCDCRLQVPFRAPGKASMGVNRRGAHYPAHHLPAIKSVRI